MNSQRRACCPSAIEGFLAGRLSGEEVHAFEDHLDDCPDCRERLADLAADTAWWDEARAFLGSEEGLEGPEGAVSEEAASLYGLAAYLAPTDDPRMLGRLGGYEIAGVIGSGGMGIVLKAFDAPLNRYVAIKVLGPSLALSASARQRFAREARAAATVVHPNVIAIHAVAEASGLPFFVMPYVRGPSLETRLRRTGRFTAIEIVRIGMQIAAGLAAAHAQGLVHRDIKPGNILLEEGVERVTITDFGLARAVDDASITHNGVIAGTPQYMSPEQARGQPVDHRTDLFSLGSVLYALSTGRAPFEAETSLAVLRCVERNQPTAIRVLNPEVPEQLAAIIDRLQATHPADRFQSAAAVASLLEAYLAHLQQPANIPAPPLPPMSGDRPFRWLATCGLATALVAALFALQPADDAPMAPPEIYQDFHGGRGPQAPLSPLGQESLMRPQDEGLRVTLPGDRDRPEQPVGLRADVHLAGDFEITATYRLHAVERPTKGPGAGVSLTVATDVKSNRWARLARVRRLDEGDVYVARLDGATDGPRLEPTTTRVGHLRLARAGSVLHYLVADEPGGAFREISRADFGSADVRALRFMVNTVGSPTAADVSLEDLRIRSGKPSPFAAQAQARPLEPGFLQDAGPSPPRSSRALVRIGLGVGFLLLLSAWLYAKHRRRPRH